MKKVAFVILFSAIIALAGCSNSPTNEAELPTHLVQYEVTSTATDIAYINCYNESYTRIYAWDPVLPWSYSFYAPSGNYLKLQVHTYSANVSVTAKIIVDGVVSAMEETSFEEPHAFVTVDYWIP